MTAPSDGAVVHPIPGARWRPTYGAPRPGGRVHRGVDLYAAEGAPIYAPEDGRIVGVGETARAGLWLAMQGARWRWSFSHLGAVELERGARVRAGDIIARTGRTGIHESEAHTHLELDRGEVDPAPVLRALEEARAVNPVDQFAQATNEAYAADRALRALIPTLSRGEQERAEHLRMQVWQRLDRWASKADPWPLGDAEQEQELARAAKRIAEIYAKLLDHVASRATPGALERARDAVRDTVAPTVASASLGVAALALVALWLLGRR